MLCLKSIIPIACWRNMREQMDLFQRFLSILAILVGAAGTEVSASPNCQNVTDALEGWAAGVSIDVDVPPAVSVGGALRMTWKAPSRSPGGVPVYAIAASGTRLRAVLPTQRADDDRVMGKPYSEVRLPGLIMLSQQARNPDGVEFGGGRDRALVPLHQPGSRLQGTVDLAPLTSGAHAFDVTLVAATPCGERVLKAPLRHALNIRSAPPDIVINEVAESIDPKTTTSHISSNGRFRVEAQNGRYSVYDGTSGAKVLERAGHDPVVSPTERFVVARVGSPSLANDEGTMHRYEVIDLVARDPIVAVDGPVIGFVHGDSYIISGAAGWGSLAICPTLMRQVLPLPFKEDRKTQCFTDGSSHFVAAWTERGPPFSLDLDNGVIVLQSLFRGRWVLELATGYNALLTQGFTFNDPPSDQDAQRLIAREYAHRPHRVADGWRSREPISFTHVPTAAELASTLREYNQPLTYIGSLSEWGKVDPPGKALVASPLMLRVAPVSLPKTRGAADTRSVVRGDWRAAGNRAGLTTPASQLPTALAKHLADFQINTLAAAPAEALPFSNFRDDGFGARLKQPGRKRVSAKEFKERNRQLRARLIDDIPLLDSYADDSDPEQRLSEDSKVLSLRPVDAGWRWQTSTGVLWLLQSFRFSGSNALAFDGSTELFKNGVSGSRAHDPARTLDRAIGFVADDDNTAAIIADDVLNHGRLVPAFFSGRWLALASRHHGSIVLYDVEDHQIVAIFRNVPNAALLEGMLLTDNAQHIIQVNRDGQFYFHDTTSKSLSVRGRLVDDEIILFTPEGYYWSSYEGAHYVNFRFPGVADSVPFRQLAVALNRPALVAARLQNAQAQVPPVTLVPPPTIVDLRHDLNGAASTITVEARAEMELERVRVYEDGRLIADVPATNREVRVNRAAELAPQSRWLTAIAIDRDGRVSAPHAIRLAPRARGNNRLHAVIVGIDSYSDPALRLQFAVSDAKRLSSVLRSPAVAYYAGVTVTSLTDARATGQGILAALRRAVNDAQPGDTLLFSFAGHGLRIGSNRYILTPTEFNAAAPEATGLEWTQISAVLDEAKSRVIVLLDACHAGQTGIGAASNDAAVQALITGARAPIVVFAASKGRQLSLEHSRWGGGLFTYAFIQAIDAQRRAFDTDASGSIEISELYRAVRTIVTRESRQSQSPWLVRHDMIGDFTVF